MKYSNFIINGIEWEVERTNANNPVLMRTDGVQTLGVTDRNKHKVYISDALTGELEKRVLTHEICHCAMFSYGIYIPLEVEEFICQFVAMYGREIIEIVDNFFGTLYNHSACVM